MNKNDIGAIKIKSIQANSLYMVNNYKEDVTSTDSKKIYLDLGEAVINKSLFSDYMLHHGVNVNRRGRSFDFILMKFDFGVKDGMTAQELREYYYKYGATVTWEFYNKTIHYKMLVRSPGMAKQGHCIFIRENLYNTALKYITMNLWDRLPEENADIVAMSAYSSLVTATALDFITIPMKNILIIKDEDAYTMAAAVSVKSHKATYEKKIPDWNEIEKVINSYSLTFSQSKQEKYPEFKCITKSKKALVARGIQDYPEKTEIYYKNECYVDRAGGKTKIKNTLFDGMGLIDESIFPGDKDMDGFIYCRSHFFKSCLFRGNIQEYFKDYYGNMYGTAIVYDMFGNEFKVADIKVIITENSIKWIKFASLMGSNMEEAYKYYASFMKEHKEKFSIVKTAHYSRYGELQRSSYQICNSLLCTDVEVLGRIAETSITYCNLLKTDHEEFMKHLTRTASARCSINNVLAALDKWNKNFKYTEYFKSKKTGIISKFKNDRLKLGKLLLAGDNLTICGNPVAMLMKATGQDCLMENCFKQIECGIQCYTARFKDGERLAGFRSPHNSPNNIIYLVNTYPEQTRKYFPKLGNNVIVINGIGTDVQSRLNGQDLDSDSVFVTNQTDIVDIAQKAYSNYPTIINGINLEENNKYGKDMLSYAIMDNKISSSQYSIGYASNIAQLALCYYFDGGSKDKGLEDVFIICSVLAQVAIDSAKRIYAVDVNGELSRLSKMPCMQPVDGKKYPLFYSKIQKLKNDGRKIRKEIQEDEIRFFNTPMDILYDIIGKNVIDIRKDKKYAELTYSLATVFKYRPSRQRDSKQYKKVISVVSEYDTETKKLDKSKSSYPKDAENLFDNCMDKLKNLHINKSTMSSLIAYAFTCREGIRDRMLIALYDKDAEIFLSCFKKNEKSSAKSPGRLINKGA